MMTDQIKAGKHFGIDKWSKLKHAAMRLVMQEHECLPEYRDQEKINAISERFKLGSPLAYYLHNKDMF